MKALSSRRLNRRSFAIGSAATVGLSFAGMPVVQIRTAAAQGKTVTWMSNQRHDEAVKRELFEEWSKESGITVDMKIFADEYPDQLKLAFESGTPPDIFNMNQPRQQVEAGWAEPLDDYLASTAGLKESFLPGAFVKNRGVWGGKTYGLPMYAQTMRFYWNKTVFKNAGLDPEAPPKTWTEMKDFSNTISEKLGGDGVYGLIFGDKYTWVWSMNATSPAQSAGAYQFDFKTGRYNFNQDGIKAALQNIIDINQGGGVFPGPHTMTDDDARQQFSIGSAGMIIGGSWNPGVFNDQFKSTEDWETAELPFPDAGLTGRVGQGIGDRYTISAQSANKEAAWEVLKFMYSLETMTTMYERGMGVMGVAAANTGNSEVRGVKALAPTKNDLILPVEPELPTITPDNVTVFQEIFDDNGSSMDEKLDGLTKAYNDTYDKAIADGLLVAEDYVVADWDPMTWQPPS
ncbi:MAG: sugar ABC transporter substrate-binding protein [Thermomicrobiales bacterium]